MNGVKLRTSIILIFLFSISTGCKDLETPSSSGDGDELGPEGDGDGSASQQSEATVIATIDLIEGDVDGARFATTGVPLANGTLTPQQLEALQLVDDTGAPVLAQFEVRGTYPDSGHVRWLGVDLIAGDSSRYDLELGAGSARRPAATLSATWQGENLVVDTGPGRFEINRQQEFISNWFVATDGRHFEGVIDEIVVEGSGPVHSVVRIAGHYENAQDQRGLFSMRLHFYAGMSDIRLDHTFTWTGSHLDLQIDELAVGVAAGAATHAHVDRADGPDSGWHTVALAGDEVSLYQQSVRHWGHGSDSFAITHGATNVASGGRAGHWIAAEADAGTTLVAIKNLWQQFPKELRVENDRVVAALYSSRGTAPPLDLRMSALEDFWGPTMNAQIDADANLSAAKQRLIDDPSKIDPTGLSKSHQLVIATSTGPMSTDVADDADALAYGPLVMPSPQHTLASGVLGALGPRDPARFPELEANTDALWDDIFTVRDDWGDYGFYAFGEGPHQNYLEFANGMAQANEWRYTMTLEYGFSLGAYLSFLRSGDRRIYDLAVANSHYNADVVLPSVDGPRRVRGDFAWSPGFTLIPWQSGAAQNYANTFGWSIERNLMHYYLTGDRRSLQAFEDYAARRKDLILEAGGIEPWVADMVATSFKNASRGSFQRLDDASLMYLQLGDPFFYDAATAIAEAFIKPENSGGLRYEPLSVGTFADPYPSYFFYKFRNMLSYLRVANGDEKTRVVEALVNMANWVYATQTAHYKIQETRGLGRLMATAYELTGQAKYLAFGLRTVRKRHDRSIAPAAEVPDGASRSYRTVDFLPIQRFVKRTLPEGAVRLGSVLRGDNMALNGPYLIGAMDNAEVTELYSAYQSGGDPHPLLPVYHNPYGFALINPQAERVVFSKAAGETLDLDLATSTAEILGPDGEPVPTGRFTFVAGYMANLATFSPTDPDRELVRTKPLHHVRVAIEANDPAGDYTVSVAGDHQLTIFEASLPFTVATP